MKLREVQIVITNKCNAKCRMCNIWKSGSGSELERAYFNNLPADLKLVAFTGGEPFLREDIVDVFRTVKERCRRAKMVILSNGLDTALIREKMKPILRSDRQVGVMISLDGLGETHDRIRGVSGAYGKAMESLQALKQLGAKDLCLNFTILDENISHIRQVYGLSEKLKINVHYILVHNSDFYYRSRGNKPPEKLSLVEEELNYVIGRELRRLSPRAWVRGYYLKGMSGYLRQGKRLFPCYAGLGYLFVNCNGDIYPCSCLAEKIGNLASADFAAMSKSRELSALYKKCPSSCWIGCTVYPVLRVRPYLAFPWIAGEKLKSLFGIKLTRN